MTESALIDEQTIENALAGYFPELEKKLPEKDVAFCKRIYAPPLERYAERIRALGFTGLDTVLDACAGFGQWALVMAYLNKQVYAFDIAPERVECLTGLSEAMDLDIRTSVSQLNAMPYIDSKFDAVFCYGSIFCTPWRESLAEIFRVLKPGGKFYCSLNGLGYQLYCWLEEPNKIGEHSPRNFVPKAFQNTLDYQKNRTAPEYGQIIIEPDEIREALDELGFGLVALDAEGHIDTSGGSHPPQPFFPSHYMGQVCCYEILAQKPGA